MKDPRLGRITQGRVEHPEVTVSGREYERPAAATRSLSKGYFVALDAFEPADEKVIDELKRKIHTATSVKGGSVERIEASGE